MLGRWSDAESFTSSDSLVVAIRRDSQASSADFVGEGTATIVGYDGASVVAASTVTVVVPDTVVISPLAGDPSERLTRLHLLEGTSTTVYVRVEASGVELDGISEQTRLVAGGRVYPTELESPFFEDVGAGLLAGTYPMQLETLTGRYGAMTIDVHARGEVTARLEDVSVGHGERVARLVLALGDGTRVFGVSTGGSGGLGAPVHGPGDDGYYYRPKAGVETPIHFLLGHGEVYSATVPGELVILDEGSPRCSVSAAAGRPGTSPFGGAAGAVLTGAIVLACLRRLTRTERFPARTSASTTMRSSP